MKKTFKVILIVFVCIILFGVIIHFTVFDVTLRGKLAMNILYGKTQASEMVNELGECENYSFSKHSKSLGVFTTIAVTLVGDYNEENYEQQKNQVLSNYKFATKEDKYIFKYTLDENSAFEFDINKWHFKLLNEGENNTEDYYNYYIPEDFRIVGFNDTDKKIAFLTFTDSDLDCFGEKNDENDLQKFVNYYSKYNFKK